MSIRNYAELQASIAGWLKRSNLTERIPDFITLAEAALNRQLRVRQMTAYYSRSTDQSMIALPDDFLEAEKIQLDGMTLTYLDRYAADSETLSTSGHDRRYTMVGQSIWLLTRVEKMSRFGMWYYQRITPLSDEEPQNWLIEDAPDAYLYGALLQAEPYLKNDARVATWGQLYGDVLTAMGVTSTRARTQGSALVMRSA
jgi:hypothetical protein